MTPDAQLALSIFSGAAAGLIAGLGGAVFSDFLTRRNHARLEALRFLLNFNTSAEFRSARALLERESHRLTDGQLAAQLAQDYATDRSGMANDQRELMHALRYVMNQHELLAICIKRGVLHEQLCADFLRTQMLADWSLLAPMLPQLRQAFSNKEIFQEVERLALRWKRRGR